MEEEDEHRTLALKKLAYGIYGPAIQMILSWMSIVWPSLKVFLAEPAVVPDSIAAVALRNAVRNSDNSGL